METTKPVIQLVVIYGERFICMVYILYWKRMCIKGFLYDF